MKMTKKLVLKKILIFILCVVILSVSVGDVFTDVNDIGTVHAAGPAALGLDVMYEICEYFGSTFLTYSCGRSLPEISDDELARLGHDFITGWCRESWRFDVGAISDPVMMTFIDQLGQSYVFGSEALQSVADTEFTVIQGGKNDGDDDDDDDNEDNIIHFPKKVAGAGKLAVALTATTATTVASVIAYQYNKWVNGDEDNILEPFFEKYPDVTASDIADQYNGHGFKLNMSAVLKDISKCNYCGDSYYGVFSVSNLDCFTPTAVYISNIGYSFRYINSRGQADYFSPAKTYTHTCCGRYTVSSSYGLSYDSISSFTVNVPIFTSLEACDNYLKTGTGYEDAINYAKEYRNADWLQDDWTGNLLDPLTGLNALSNWYNIARHQGLNALGDDPSVDDMSDYLRDYFAQNGTDVLPEVDPSLAPVKYPATLPDVVIDPAKNPAVSPVTIPSVNPDPGSKPDPGTDPNPGTDPDPGTDTEVTINVSDYQVDLRRLFPFCIPFDFIALLNVLDADPVAPCFNFPVAIPALDYQETIKLDMSIFDDVAKVIRICEKVSFLIFLMFATSKVIRW